MNFKTLTLCTLLGFTSLTGVDEVVIPQYSEFLGSLKFYFEGVEEIVKFLDKGMNDTDLGDEREVLLLHMLFIENQIELIKRIQPDLDKTYKHVFYELGPYGG